MGIYQFSFFLGAASGAILGGSLTDRLGFHQALIVGAVLTVAVLFAFVFIIGCGDGGGDGDSTPTYDATGEWTITSSAFRLVKGECTLDEEMTQATVDTIDVVQDGDSFTSTGEDGEEVTGRVDGAVYSYVIGERVTNDDGDLVDIVRTMTATFSSATSFSGKVTLELIAVETRASCVFEQDMTGEKN